MATITELEKNIKSYQAEIKWMEKENAQLANSVRIFDRTTVVENKSKIQDYAERIARLERQISGTPETGAPTERQVMYLEYVNSKDYDEL